MKILLALLLGGCALFQTKPEIYPAHELVKELLVPRENHKGLTNANCAAFDDSGKCTNFVIRDWDLEDANIRTQLNRLNFICTVGLKRYKVCQDKPGLCRITSVKSCWLCAPKPIEEDYIPQSDVQKLLNAGTQCFSEDIYSQEDVQ